MRDKQRCYPVKHIPQRTCVVCRKKIGKRELVRLVCVPGGGVVVDTTGKKAGRGAYLCSTLECWQNALKSGRLEHALRTSISQQNRDELISYAQGFESEGVG